MIPQWTHNWVESSPPWELTKSYNDYFPLAYQTDILYYGITIYEEGYDRSRTVSVVDTFPTKTYIWYKVTISDYDTVGYRRVTLSIGK